MYQLQFNPADKMPKYKQIVQSVMTDIERGVLKKGDQLPSISELSGDYDLARDTVEKAYRELRERGFLTSVQGKGYYVQAAGEKKLKILLLFNKLSSYKKRIYYAFLDVLGDQATVDLQIHHYNPQLFEEILERSLGKYNYYVVMPHFTLATPPAEVRRLLGLIPAPELVLLDKYVPDLPRPVISVYQDFNRDIGGALDALVADLMRYPRMVMLLPSDDNYPVEIDRGFRQFCRFNDKDFAVKESVLDAPPVPGTAYVVLRETDLADLVKNVRQAGYTVGREIGIITFNETPLKELLDMTVISTDFEHMGRTAAHLILEKKIEQVKNPFYTVRRGSL